MGYGFCLYLGIILRWVSRCLRLSAGCGVGALGVSGHGRRASPAFFGWGLLSVSGYGSGRNITFLGRVFGMCVLAWVPTVMRHFWPAFVAFGLVLVSPEARLSWLDGVCWLVFPALPGRCMLLSCVGWVVPLPSWRIVVSGVVVPH